MTTPSIRLAAIDDSARKLIILAGGLIFLFFGVFGGWAAFAELEGAVVSQGNVAVEGYRKPIQHRDGGIVRQILVREGEHVATGQPLMVLDVTDIQANIDITEAQFDAMKLRESRLVAERAGATSFEVPAGLSKVRQDQIDEELQLLRSRRSALDSEIALRNQQMVQLKESIVGLQSQRDSKSKQVHSLQSQVDGMRDLQTKGYAPRVKLMELERDLAGLTGTLGELDSRVNETRQRMLTLDREIALVRSKEQEEINSKLKEAQDRLAEIGPRLRALKEQLSRATVIAPEDGYVLGLTVHGVPTVISPGEKVMEIVPSTGDLVIEAPIHTDEIEAMHVGMEAQVKLIAFKTALIPTVPGKVLSISADRMVDPRSGLGFYMTKVQVSQEDVHAVNASLQPGMPVMVVIPTRPRTVLTYLLNPISKTLVTAFREK
ncbi:MAG: HlyD family type I secretion periplasmic adaptor subunit [Solirubrobacterales bacterium]